MNKTSVSLKNKRIDISNSISNKRTKINDIENKINDQEKKLVQEKNNLEDKQKKKKIPPGYLEENFVTDIIQLIEQIKTKINKEDINDNITRLEILINRIEKSNAITTVGTLDFTDTMAKYGLNKTVCNYKNTMDPIIEKLVDVELKDIIENKKISISDIKEGQNKFFKEYINETLFVSEPK